MTRNGHSPSVFFHSGWLFKHARFDITCKTTLIWFNNIIMNLCHKLCRKNVNEIGPNIKLYEA